MKIFRAVAKLLPVAGGLVDREGIYRLVGKLVGHASAAASPT